MASVVPETKLAPVKEHYLPVRQDTWRTVLELSVLIAVYIGNNAGIFEDFWRPFHYTMVSSFHTSLIIFDMVITGFDFRKPESKRVPDRDIKISPKEWHGYSVLAVAALWADCFLLSNAVEGVRDSWSDEHIIKFSAAIVLALISSLRAVTLGYAELNVIREETTTRIATQKDTTS